MTRSNGRGRGHRLISLVGQPFERLTVIARAPNIKSRSAHWHCVCDCGTEVIVDGKNLRRGHTRSCGCLRPDATRRSSTKHGQSYTPEYRAYIEMKNRCLNPDNHAYNSYGGRGILLLWNSLEEFVQDMGLRPTPEHSIERIDNNGPYSRENCCWATRKEQSNNRRSTRYVKYEGRMWTLAHLAEHLGLPYQTLYHRVKHGRPLSSDSRTTRHIDYEGRIWTLPELAKHLDVPYATLRARIDYGRPLV